MSMIGGSDVRSTVEIPSVRLMKQDMSSRGSVGGGWGLGRATIVFYDDNFYDLVMLVRCAW